MIRRSATCESGEVTGETELDGNILVINCLHLICERHAAKCGRETVKRVRNLLAKHGSVARSLREPHRYYYVAWLWIGSRVATEAFKSEAVSGSHRARQLGRNSQIANRVWANILRISKISGSVRANFAAVFRVHFPRNIAQWGCCEYCCDSEDKKGLVGAIDGDMKIGRIPPENSHLSVFSISLSFYPFRFSSPAVPPGTFLLHTGDCHNLDRAGVFGK